MTDREDDTIGQLAEDILRRFKALGPFSTIELKELVEEAQILIPRDEMDRLSNTYVISDYHYHLLTGPTPLPLVATPRMPGSHLNVFVAPVSKSIAPIS